MEAGGFPVRKPACQDCGMISALPLPEYVMKSKIIHFYSSKENVAFSFSMTEPFSQTSIILGYHGGIAEKCFQLVI